MKPSFEPLLEETLKDLYSEEGEQLKLFPDPEMPKPDTTAKALLKELERTGGMSYGEIQKFTFERRRNKDNKEMSRGWWSTNISSMTQGKVIIKEGKVYKVNPTIDINKLKISIPKWQPYFARGKNTNSSKANAANIAAAKKD